MNLNKVCSESGLSFQRFHEDLNHVLKTNVISLSLFKLTLDEGLSKEEIKQRVYKTGELWGGMPSWKNPHQLIIDASNDLGCNGVIRVFSAFDLFLTSIEGEIESWNSFRGLKETKTHQQSKSLVEENNETDRCFKFLTKQSWKVENENHIKVVYLYYRYSRDCIAHRDGIASRALEEIADSKEIKDAISRWREFSLDKTPPIIKAIKFGKKIQFDHRDAILASSITRTIAINMNRALVNNLGIDGLVYLAAQRYILKDDTEIVKPKAKNAVDFLVQLLREKNRLAQVGRIQVSASLKSLGIFERCGERFKTLATKQVAV